MAGGRVHGSSKFSLLLPNQTSPSFSSQPLDSLFLSGSSSSFLGSSSMVSFEDANKSKRAGGSFFRRFDSDDNCDDDFDEYLNQPGKKRRLTVDQVQFLEKSFEVENKLEPDRKIQLAQDLGLQPRQIAIWFQNRRARWKTKQMEKDYDVLQSSYDSLKADYENLLKEKENLKAEVLSLSEQLINKEQKKQYLGISDLNRNACNPYGLPDSQIANSVSEGSESKLSNIASKQEEFTSAKSDILESSGSPNYATDGCLSPHLDHADSSYAFEPDPSDGSQDEEESFLPISAYSFPKLEDSDYPNLPTSSCNFAFPMEDQAIWSWSY